MAREFREDMSQLDEFFGEEELDPELEPYIQENEMGWPVLKHPLVFQIPYSPHMNKMANRGLHSKRDAIKRALDERNWSSFIWLHERPYRSQAFAAIAQDLSDPEYWDVLRIVWEDSENIWQTDLPEALMSTRPGREHFMDDVEQANLRMMDDYVKVWRGYTKERGTKFGWSWTMRKKVAEWFAQRFAFEGQTMMVVEGIVHRDDILAVVHTRNEAELIVDPENVSIVRHESEKK